MTTGKNAPGGASEPGSALPTARAGTPRRAQIVARAAEGLVLAGLLLHAVFAPHSIAGAWIALSVVASGWLARTLLTRGTNITRTAFDLPLWAFYGWTIASIFLSAEPRVSLSKLPAASTFLVFYLAQGVLRRGLVPLLAGLMIVSAAAGVVWSLAEVARGRGVVVEEIGPESALAREVPQLRAGDAVWRVGDRRVGSVADIEAALRDAPEGVRPPLHVISRGEHVVWDGPVVTPELKSSPSGLRGAGRTHRFRASGWTRHYGTHAELLQMLAQLALGFALANFLRRGERTGDAGGRARRKLGARVWLPAGGFVLLGAGVALTAMRTALVAFACGALVVAWRAASGARARLAVALAVVVLLSLGALAVSRTRASGALLLRDDSAAMRLNVARHAVERVPLRPVFGHGMDAAKVRWEEWGFPGTERIHFHSTWVQIAFDRGLPALALWLWLVCAFWLTLRRAERMWRESGDAPAHGFALGASGALAGFFVSSAVNYNFGDAEVALLFWWLAGATVAHTTDVGGRRPVKDLNPTRD